MEDDGDVDIYSDVGEFGVESKHDAKGLLTEASANLDLLDTSVIPRQDSPVKTNDRPPLIPQKPEVSSVSGDLPTAKGSVAHDPSADAQNKPAQLSNAAKAIAALKKENGTLRHNISVLYMTAKHLLEAKDKEITNLKRRLDNVVFRRNQGAQENSHNSPKTRGLLGKRGHSPHDHPPEPPGAGQGSDETQSQKPCHSLQRPVTLKPKVDMSEDLQRLYDYNGVKPQHRTEFSEVPLLAFAPRKKETTPPGRVAGSTEPAKPGHRTGLGRLPALPRTPRKREMTPCGVMASPTKSAAQRNARRLVKNSIKKAVASPTKHPRRLELHKVLPLKGRRFAEGDQVHLRKRPVNSSLCQPSRQIDRQPNKMETHCRRLEGQETFFEPNKPLDKAPLSKSSITEHKSSPVGAKRIIPPLMDGSSPLRFPRGHNSEHGTRNLKGLEEDHHIPAKRRRSRSRSLSRSPPPRPGSPRDHLTPSRRSLHDHINFSHVKHRSPRLHPCSPERQYSSPESRGPRQRSQERRSPLPHWHPQSDRRIHSPSPPPRLPTTSQRPLSPRPQRPRSPCYEDKGFGYLSSPPRHSRAALRQLSPGPRRPRSPYQEDEGLRQALSPPRLSRNSQRLVSPGQRPRSPCREGKGLGHLPSPPRLSRTSQRLGSPGRRPRGPYREDKGLMQPGSPPRGAGTSKRQHSPGKRPRSPYDTGMGSAHSASPPRQLGISRRQHSPGRRRRNPYDGDGALVHSPSPPRHLGTSQREHSPGRRPWSPYHGDAGLPHSPPPPRLSETSRRQHSPERRPRSPYVGDTGLTHSESPPQQSGISRRRHSPVRRPRSPCDGDKSLGHSRTSQRQHSPVRKPKSLSGVDKGVGNHPARKTLAKKPIKTAPRAALSSVVKGNTMEQGNDDADRSKAQKNSGPVLKESELSAGQQDNIIGGGKLHEKSARVLEEGELSDSD